MITSATAILDDVSLGEWAGTPEGMDRYMDELARRMTEVFPGAEIVVSAEMVGMDIFTATDDSPVNEIAWLAEEQAKQTMLDLINDMAEDDPDR